MIPISADEIKQYWNDYCDRQAVLPSVRAAGVKLIEADPEHWADQTMPDLLAHLTPQKAQ